MRQEPNVSTEKKLQQKNRSITALRLATTLGI